MEEENKYYRKIENFPKTNTGFWKVFLLNYVILVLGEVLIVTLWAFFGSRGNNKAMVLVCSTGGFLIVQWVVCLYLGTRASAGDDDGRRSGLLVSAFVVPVAVIMTGIGGCMVYINL